MSPASGNDPNDPGAGASPALVRRAALPVVALAVGMLAAWFVFFGGSGGGPDRPVGQPYASVEPRDVFVPTIREGTGRCVSAALALSRAEYAIGEGDYALTAPDGSVTPGRFPASELSRNIVRLDLESLPDGPYTLALAADDRPVAFTVDRTAPTFVSSDPSLETCPGEAMRVTLADEADPAQCGPVTCLLEHNRKPVAQAFADADGGALVCSFPTDDLAGDAGDEDGRGSWRLRLRDGAGNSTLVPIAWPDATLTVRAPDSAGPGQRIIAEATGTPGGGEFAVNLLSSDGTPPDISVQSRPGGSVATIRFTAPRDSQTIGLDIAYRPAAHCPAVRPIPAEIDVSTDAPGRRYVVPEPSACGNGERDEGEVCDPGNGDASCNYDCTASRCGDGVLNPYAGEQCDGTPGCGEDCTLSCGDGRVDATERCDGGGETAACNLDCTLTRCGDEITNLTAGEQCDDGNVTAGDGCSATCRIEGSFEEEGDPGLGIDRWFGR